MKIHGNFKVFAGVHFDATKYVESPAYGVSRFMLDRVGSERARATTIVKYNPNSHFPEHVHIGGEEFLVLEGTFKDQFGVFPAGTYVRNPIGSKHSPWVDDDGCTIWVKLLQMAETVGEDTTPLHVDIEGCKATQGTDTNYGTVMTMYSNEMTGELVQFCWIHADHALPSDSLSIEGGEELFVMSGSLVMQHHNEDGTTTTTTTDEGSTTTSVSYEKWGWLRFPAGSRRNDILAGKDGARVLRKTGHLTTKALSMEKIQITDA